MLNTGLTWTMPVQRKEKTLLENIKKKNDFQHLKYIYCISLLKYVEITAKTQKRLWKCESWFVSFIWNITFIFVRQRHKKWTFSHTRITCRKMLCVKAQTALKNLSSYQTFPSLLWMYPPSLSWQPQRSLWFLARIVCSYSQRKSEKQDTGSVV